MTEGLPLVVYIRALPGGDVALAFVALLAVTGIGRACVNGIVPAFVAEHCRRPCATRRARPARSSPL